MNEGDRKSWLGQMEKRKTSVDTGHEFGYCLYIAMSSGDVGSTNEVFQNSQKGLMNRVSKL